MADEMDRPAYITDADWDIIKARFERIERRLELLQAQADAIGTTCLRVDELVHAHQPFIDRVRTEAVGTLLTTEKDSGPTLDGRTFMTLCRWAQYIEQLARPVGNPALRWRDSKHVTATVSQNEYAELTAALVNAKDFLAHVKVIES